MLSRKVLRSQIKSIKVSLRTLVSSGKKEEEEGGRGGEVGEGGRGGGMSATEKYLVIKRW